MEKINKEMIATLVKDGRIAKGYTQKELGEITNISIRSIQRIENASLIPRSYTLKTIAQALELPFTVFTPYLQEINNADVEDPTSNSLKATVRITRPQKIILSIATPLVVVLISIAFISQSSRFPETTFEITVFWSVISIILTALLYFIWQPKKQN